MQKSIVAYYSWSGQIRKMAELIAAQTGADLLEIEPESPYTDNYNEVVAQAKDEIRRDYHPAIKKVDYDLSKYNVIYVGSPIWWGTVAPPIATFLNDNDLKGKTIMPFTSHGGGGKGHSDRDITKWCSEADVKTMYTAYGGGSQEALCTWIKKEIE